MKPVALIITCEHAVNVIPVAYQPYFIDHAALLETHRGVDLGAKIIARHLSDSFHCPFFAASVSRLLIDCNRSLSHAECFSEISMPFSDEEKADLVTHYYRAFRDPVEKTIQAHIANGYRVCHLSIHSFTPVLHHVTRHASIGLLYDPKRSHEKALIKKWQHLLIKHCSHQPIRLNYPYKGTSDGFTTWLRKQFDDASYMGIEVEVNQALTKHPVSLADIINALDCSLKLTL